jgi:hypothetical protein
LLEIIIDNRDGNLWDISGIASEVSFKTSRIGKAATLEFTMLQGGFYESSAFKYNCGDVIRVKKDAKPVFFGYIFTIDGGRDESVKITAYDQLRYLTGSDTYVFQNATLGEIIKRITADMNLKVGKIAETNYKIPKMLEDGSVLLDIIYSALSKTLIATGQNYVFWDNFGELTLSSFADLRLPIYLGDVSMMYDYKQKRSIDSDTYNRIKIVRDNKEKGIRDVYVTPKNSNMDKWGVLQLYIKVDDGLNEAQIKQNLSNYFALKNREKRTFTSDFIGDIRIRAGNSLAILIEEAGINENFVVNECTHKFDGVDHTMSLELQVYG